MDEIAKADLKGHAEFKTMWPAGVHGVGKNGHPIYGNRSRQSRLPTELAPCAVERPGKVDPDKVWKQYK